MNFPRRLNGIGTGDMAAKVDIGDEPDSQMFGFVVGESSQLLNILAGGFKHFLFSPLVGEDSHFD